MSAALSADVAVRAPSPAVPVARPRIAPPTPRALAERAVGEATLRLAAEHHRLAVACEWLVSGRGSALARVAECSAQVDAAGRALADARRLRDLVAP